MAYLDAHPEIDEIYIESDDMLHDFKCEVMPEVFDGFDSVYPECIKLINID